MHGGLKMTFMTVFWQQYGPQNFMEETSTLFGTQSFMEM